MRQTVALIGVVVLCALAAAAARADDTGRITGRVTDQDARPVVGARVTITGRGAVGRYEAVTDEGGNYAVPGLPLRQPLEVRAEATGLTPMAFSGLLSRPGFGTRRDFRLRPPGSHEVLILVDRGWEHHRTVVDGARSTLDGSITELEIAAGRLRDGRRLKEAMASLPNGVVAVGRRSARLARREIKNAPVVFSMVPDPIGDDLTTTNMCGIALNGGAEGQLDRLSEVDPGARRLVTVYDPRRLARAVLDLRRAAFDRGMTVRAVPARDGRQVVAALEARALDGADAFYLLADPDLLEGDALARIREAVARRGLIAVVPDLALADTATAVSAVPGFHRMGAHAGRLLNVIISTGLAPSSVGTEIRIDRREPAGSGAGAAPPRGGPSG